MLLPHLYLTNYTQRIIMYDQCQTVISKENFNILPMKLE